MVVCLDLVILIVCWLCLVVLVCGLLWFVGMGLGCSCNCGCCICVNSVGHCNDVSFGGLRLLFGFS